MKKNLILQSMGLLIMMGALMFLLSSCSKSANGNLTKEQAEKLDSNSAQSLINGKDISETDEDLFTVDYKEFYDQLAPHGEWVQVNPEDLGMKPKPVVSNNSPEKIFTLSNLFGINNAYASTDANVAMIYVWKPSTDLAVVNNTGDAPVYTPYSNGQWVNSDAGWYFKAPTPVEETTSHYGRWVNSPTAGWLWVPGRVWAPAWVDWRQNESYESWAPLPPSNYMVNGTMSSPVIDNNSYVIVNRQHFLEPNVSQYNNPYYDNGSRIMVADLAPVTGLMLVNDLIVNRGPDVNVLRTLLGRAIDVVTIQHVTTYPDVRYLENQYYVYTPQFTRYRQHDNGLHKGWGPKNYRQYDEWKDVKSDQKEYKKEQKDIRKNIPGDDGNMYYKNGKDNKLKNNDKGNQERYDNGNRHEGNDNGKKKENNDNGKKNNGNDNGKKNENNDNGKKNENNDNGKKNNGNDNGREKQGNDNGKGKK